MNLTEPAGRLRRRRRSPPRRCPPTTASWRITGQKIFITYGEHDLTDNIVHLVLARMPDAPPGTKGISLLHRARSSSSTTTARSASATASRASSHRAQDGHPRQPHLHAGVRRRRRLPHRRRANEGMRYMFTMMNNARLSVGLEGLAPRPSGPTSRRSPYAQERRQGRAIGAPAGRRQPDHRARRRAPDAAAHPQAYIEAMRGAASTRTRAAIDLATPPPRRGRAPGARSELADLLTPHHQGVVHRPRHRAAPRSASRSTAAWATSRRPASAQHYRDVRIAADLRGHQRHPGHGPRRPQAADAGRRRSSPTSSAAIDGRRAGRARRRPRRPRRAAWPTASPRCARRPTGCSANGLEPTPTTPWPAPRRTCGCSARSLGGWLLARQASPLGPGAADPRLAAKVATARYYSEQVLPPARGLVARGHRRRRRPLRHPRRAL